MSCIFVVIYFILQLNPVSESRTVVSAMQHSAATRKTDLSFLVLFAFPFAVSSHSCPFALCSYLEPVVNLSHGVFHSALTNFFQVFSTLLSL